MKPKKGYPAFVTAKYIPPGKTEQAEWTFGMMSWEGIKGAKAHFKKWCPQGKLISISVDEYFPGAKGLSRT